MKPTFLPDSRVESSSTTPLWIRRVVSAILAAALLVWATLFVTFVWLGFALRPDASEQRELNRALSTRAPFEPTNILLVGVDRTKQGTRRADTILLLRVDSWKRRVWLLSVPRDANIGLSSKPRAPAPACRAALAQATLKAPRRRTASDGILSGAQHDKTSPTSDHRWGYAFDLTHDPDNGIDCARVAESLRRSRDARIKYVIFNGRYFSAREGWRWRPYTGDNQHTRHLHVSVLETEAGNTEPWPGIMYEVEPTPIRDVISRLSGAPANPDEAVHPAMGELVSRKKVKANRAYSVGGAALTVDAVERLLDLPIHHYAEVDFDGVTALVDAVGGIEIDVPESIDDRRAADASPGRRARRISAGRQLLDGEHALTFLRSRQYRDSDFGRVRNQQTFMKAALMRLLSPAGIVRIPALAAAAGNHAMTDLTPPQLVKLMGAIAVTDATHRSSATLVGPWRSPVVMTDPRRRVELVSSMRDGTDFLPMPSEVTIAVLNGSGRTGEGRRVAFELSRRGFPVVRVDNAASSDYEVTTVISREQDEQGARLVSQSLHNARRQVGTDEEFDARILVIVGKD